MRFILILALAVVSSPVYAELLIRDAWVRATPPGARTAAVYLTVENQGADDALVSATADAADDTQLHTHRHEDGMMRMEQVETFALPANGATSLAPGGKHLMMIGITRALKPGEEVSLKLGFQRHDPILLTVPVRDGRKP